MRPRIGLLGAGYGNVFSVSNALAKAGAKVVEAEADAYVLPGVGSFASSESVKRQFSKQLSEIREGKPLLGICLGMQLLFERSEEGGGAGLGFFKGEVRKLKAPKLPHMGWNSVSFDNSALGEGIQKEWFYFVHSYACPPSASVKGWCEYGQKVPAVVEEGNLFGVQFHPEKSGSAGRKLLENFMEAVRQWK